MHTIEWDLVQTMRFYRVTVRKATMAEWWNAEGKARFSRLPATRVDEGDEE